MERPPGKGRSGYKTPFMASIVTSTLGVPPIPVPFDPGGQREVADSAPAPFLVELRGQPLETVSFHLGEALVSLLHEPSFRTEVDGGHGAVQRRQPTAEKGVPQIVAAAARASGRANTGMRRSSIRYRSMSTFR
jgi:hypothetical protein